MTHDPEEGVDNQGFIRTGVARDRVPPVYEPLITEVADRLFAAFGSEIHGLYLYGSVATGRAHSPASDLDLLALWSTGIDRAGADPIAAEISAAHTGLVREVGLVHAELEELTGESDAAAGLRCFLHHYCLRLRGAAIDDLSPCRVGPALVRGFNGDFTASVAGWSTDLAAAGSRSEVESIARTASRRLLLAAATAMSVRQGGWSTDRATAVALVSEHEPAWAADAARALAWSALPLSGSSPAGRYEVHRLLRGFGYWVAAQCPPGQPIR